MKKRTRNVLSLIISSGVIFVILACCVFAILLATLWKDRILADRYSQELTAVRTQWYRPLVSVYNLKAVSKFTGIGGDQVYIRGGIKNSGKKTITSIEVMVHFLDDKNSGIFSAEVSPLTPRASSRLYIAPGGSVGFSSLVNDCPAELERTIKDKRYRGHPPHWSGKLDYQITRIEFQEP